MPTASAALRVTFCVASLLAAAHACASPARRPRADLPPLGDALPWVGFRWQGATIADRWVERAALMIPATLDGIREAVELQLDSGAGWTTIYGTPYRQLDPSHLGVAPDSSARISGTIAGYRVRDEEVLFRPGYGASIRPGAPRLVGTLGLRFFRGRVLVLDFPGRRLAIVDSATPLPPELASRVAWVDATYRNGHLFVPMTIDGRTYDDFFFDTGASLFPINTSRRLWRELTGRTGDEADNVVWWIYSWGQRVKMVGAPLTGTVRVGTSRVENPLVFHPASEGPFPDYDKWPYKVAGLFGNAMLYERYAVIVDVPRRRFGLVPRR